MFILLSFFYRKFPAMVFSHTHIQVTGTRSAFYSEKQKKQGKYPIISLHSFNCCFVKGYQNLSKLETGCCTGWETLLYFWVLVFIFSFEILKWMSIVCFFLWQIDNVNQFNFKQNIPWSWLTEIMVCNCDTCCSNACCFLWFWACKSIMHVVNDMNPSVWIVTHCSHVAASKILCYLQIYKYV